MQDPKVPRPIRWPFLLAAAALFGLAAILVLFRHASLDSGTLVACILCAIAGAALATVPFVLEYRARTLMAEADRLAEAMTGVQNLEQLAAQIGYATSQWHLVRESADKTARNAKDIAQGMAVEVKNFGEFLQRANDGEKSALRLEVEKLRRSEGEWLQVLIRMLDHVFALHQAAERSGQPRLIEQIRQFQSVCHDAVRRIGLTPFVASPAEPFDGQRHQVFEGPDKPAPGAAVTETVATGYTYQGRLLRPALVRLQQNGHGDPANATGTNPEARVPDDSPVTVQ